MLLMFQTNCVGTNRFTEDTMEIIDVWNPKGPHEFEIPSGTVLKVDRVYIRKGAEDFSSITFIISISPDKRLATKKFGGTASKTIRFWTKIKETRKMNIKETP